MSHNPGNPGRGPHRGGGRGRGEQRGGRERSRGRPLNSSDRVLMYQMLGSLNAGGRRQLATLVTEFVGIHTGDQGNTPPVERREPSVAPEKSPKRIRIWDRPILKDVPAVHEFAKKSSKERGQDTETSQRLSIATGAIARGRIASIADEDILNDLISHWSDATTLHALYQKVDTSSASAGSGIPDGKGSSLLSPDESGFASKVGVETSTVNRTLKLSIKTAKGEDDARKAQVAQTTTLVEVPASGTEAKASSSWASECEEDSSDESVAMADATSLSIVELPVDSPGKALRKKNRPKKKRSRKS